MVLSAPWQSLVFVGARSPAQPGRDAAAQPDVQLQSGSTSQASCEVQSTWVEQGVGKRCSGGSVTSSGNLDLPGCALLQSPVRAGSFLEE